MLIIKGGISREIDKKNLQQYLDKGYKPVEKEQNIDLPKNKEKLLNKMTTAELESKAVELGVDISECKTNAERVDLIQAVINAAQESGE